MSMIALAVCCLWWAAIIAVNSVRCSDECSIYFSWFPYQSMLPNLLVYNSMYQTAVCEKVNKTFSCSGIKRLQQEQKTHFWERPLSNIENNQFVHRTALFPHCVRIFCCLWCSLCSVSKWGFCCLTLPWTCHVMWSHRNSNTENTG